METVDLNQLQNRWTTCTMIFFTPIDVEELTPQEELRSMEALIFLNEKQDKSIMGRLVYNRKPTREWLSIED